MNDKNPNRLELELMYNGEYYIWALDDCKEDLVECNIFINEDKQKKNMWKLREFPYHKFIKLNFDQFLFFKKKAEKTEEVKQSEKVKKKILRYYHIDNDVKKLLIETFNEVALKFDKKKFNESLDSKKRGQKLEPIVNEVLISKGLRPPTDFKNTSGKTSKDTKFPDTAFVYKKKIYYVEIKSNRCKIKDSDKVFDVSILVPRPIKMNAYHFIFSLYVKAENGLWVYKEWKVRDLYDLIGTLVIYRGPAGQYFDFDRACFDFNSNHKGIKDLHEVVGAVKEPCEPKEYKKVQQPITKYLKDSAINNKISGFKKTSIIGDRAINNKISGFKKTSIIGDRAINNK